MVLSRKAPVSLLQVQNNVVYNEPPSLESSKNRIDNQVFEWFKLWPAQRKGFPQITS